MRYLIPLLLLFISCSEEEITPDAYVDCRPEMQVDQSKAYNGLIEFDIIPDIKSNNRGAVLTAKERLWKDATIPYYLRKWSKDENNHVTMGFRDQEDINKIHSVIKELGEQTGVKLIHFDSREDLSAAGFTDGVMIIPGFMASSSFLGRQGGIQRIELAHSLKSEDIKHEFLHALGFAHEFNRTDRDEHITILLENVPQHSHRQFDINSLTVDCGEFDINSVMMYGSFQFEGDNPVITTIEGETFEMPGDLSKGDIATLKAMYNLN